MEKSRAVSKLLNETRQKMSGYMRSKIDDCGLTITQSILVGHVYHNGKMKISELGKVLGLSNSTVSGLVDRLEKTDTVTRVRSKEDRRVVYVRVTEDFMNKHGTIESSMEGFFEEVFKNISDAKIEKIIEGLSELSEALDSMKETGE